MKLKNLLVTIFIFISSVPLFFSLQYINLFTEKQFRTQIESKLSALSLVAKKRILAVVDRVKDNTTLLSSRTQMRISLVEWTRTGNPDHLETIQKILLDARLGLTRLNVISIYDTQKRLVTSTDKFADQPLSEEPPKSGALIVLEHREAEVFISGISALILDNERIGYLKASFYADFVLDLINDRSGLGTTGEWLFAVRNEEGDALFAVPLKYDENAAFKRSVSKDRLDVPITQALLGNEIIMSHAPDYSEVPVLASTRYLPILDLGLVVKITESEIDDIVERSNRVLLWLELFLILISLLVGIGISLNIAKPIETLRARTSKLATGNFEAEPPVKGWWSEVTELSKAFNQMAISLKDLNENLNQKVKERTIQLDEANRKLLKIAIRDPLTNLYNRRFINERLRQELSRAKRAKTGLAFVLLDLDRFKSINDKWGHGAGDAVLQKVSKYLRKTLRESDISGRFGGEEFCIIFPYLDAAGILPLLERIRIDISQLNIDYEGNAIRVTCSFGVALLSEEFESTEDLIKCADIALYKAKETGRNKVVLHGDPDSGTVK